MRVFCFYIRLSTWYKIIISQRTLWRLFPWVFLSSFSVGMWKKGEAVGRRREGGRDRLRETMRGRLGGAAAR